ncbi:MAG: hypothetical protein HY555_02800 [Euryarchaeota archaeon]|nr:hypothetical protein [Euryarchaeota archaeon]
MEEATEIDKKAALVYEAHRRELESKHTGRVVALDLDEGDVAAVGDDPSEVSLQAESLRPAHRLFVRRVGRSPAVLRMR